MPGRFLKARQPKPTDTPAGIPTSALLSEEQERLLMRRVAAQDRQAFDTLYRHYAPRLHRYLSRLIPQAENREEVLDDVMVVVWQNAARFDGTAKPSTWIFGIAYNKALKACAQHHRQTGTSLPPPLEQSHNHDPAERLQQQELQGELARALDCLSPEQRTVVELTYQEACSYQEIATIMECPLNTVKTRMWHARRHLAQALAGLRRSSAAATRPAAARPGERPRSETA
jgi:RNA polymerase sigma-70 factor (ECF subfamily)